MMKFRLQTLTTLVFVLLCYCTVYARHIGIQDAVPTRVKDSSKRQQMSALVLKQMTHYHVPGLSVAIIKNYHVVFVKGYGWADKSLKIPVTAKTLFQAASISKSLNGIGVLKLAQQHKVDLFTDINKYLTSWKFPYDSLSKGKKITLAHLLSHTGGITFHGFHGYNPGAVLPTTLQILNGEKPANSEPIRAHYEPGIRFDYSGGGVYLSQVVVQDVTHKPYADFMKRAVLDPLKMTASSFAQPPFHKKSFLPARGYDIGGNSLPGKYYVYPEQASTSLWTNPTDLAKYIIETQLSYEGRSAKILNQQFTRLRLTPYLNESAGLGVFISDLGGNGYFNHSGENAGFRSIYYGSLEGGNGIIVMVNSDNGEIMDQVVAGSAVIYGLKGLAR